jgi:acetyl-CoA synthetase
LAKESLDYIPLASLKVIGSVGEPINEEAWHWYNDHVGDKRCPVVDLVANRNWWNYDFANTICYAYKTYLHQLPVQPVLMDERRNEIEGNQVVGSCIKFPWPGIARTIWGDHQRYKKPIFCLSRQIFYWRWRFA